MVDDPSAAPDLFPTDKAQEKERHWLFRLIEELVQWENMTTVRHNEIITSLNKPEECILAIVEFMGSDTHRAHYMCRPFLREPDFGVVSVNYAFGELMAKDEGVT
jgi:hypothetical protein